jgi:hypothetical protein
MLFFGQSAISCHRIKRFVFLGETDFGPKCITTTLETSSPLSHQLRGHTPQAKNPHTGMTKQK